MRYDQRDALPYRSQLVPGTKEYKLYYSMHPELEEMDGKVRTHYNESLASKVRLKQFPQDWLANAWVYGTKHTTGHTLRHSFDGVVNEEEIKADFS